MTSVRRGLWVAVDDTDGPDGGCTTFVLTEILRAALEVGLAPLGPPRLVRLNPNVPWRTRGNGALAVRLGHGVGRGTVIGSIAGRSVRAFARGRAPTGPERRRFERLAWALVGRLSAPADRADPALLTVDRPLPVGLYRRAVSELVSVRDARRAVRAAGGRLRVRRSARGLVGAAGAVAWPARRRTFELLAYRRPKRLGTPRRIERGSVAAVDRTFPGLALNLDPRTRRLLIAPHTACPILYGLRGRDAGELRRARRRLRTEPVDRWLLFESNQGTGDHLVRRSGRSFRPRSAGRVVGSVGAMPQVLRGGHVRFPIRTADGTEIDCLAFEPTKTLGPVAASLRPGDRVEVAGGRSPGGAVHLERLTIRSLAERPARRRPPRCPACGVTAHSLGRGRGYRCRRCHARFPPERAEPVPAEVRYGPGTYDPTPSARRHLHPWPPGRESVTHPVSRGAVPIYRRPVVGPRSAA